MGGLLIGAGHGTLQSAALISTSDDLGGNSVTVGTWPASDFRSVASGPWSAAGTWQQFNGTSWLAAARPPESDDGVVTVSSPNVVAADLTDDVAHVVITAGAQLTVAGGVSLTVDSETWTSIDVLGTLNVAGTLAVSPAGTVTIEAGGQVQDAGTIGGSGTIISNGGSIQAMAAGTTTGLPIRTNSGLTVAGVNALTLSGSISGTGALAKTGTGSLTLAGANTYSGTTTVSAGVVDLQASAALGGVGTTTVASGAALNVDGTGLAIANPLSLNGTGVGATGALRNLANANSWSGAISLAGAASIASDGGTLTLGAISATAKALTVTGTGNTTVGGVIALTTGALAKTGTGSLTLAGANTYSGTTTVSAGTLSVDGSTAAGATSVAVGATLRGSGTVAGTVSVSGTLLPGESPGQLVSGAVTFVSGAAFAIEIGGTSPGTGYDQEQVASGATTINSSVNLSLVDLGGFTPTVGQTYVILSKTAAGAIGGTFNGLAQGATIANFLGSSLHAQISYAGGDGNDVVLTVTP